jgi:hypothetical protein
MWFHLNVFSQSDLEIVDGKITEHNHVTWDVVTDPPILPCGHVTPRAVTRHPISFLIQLFF